MATQMPTIGEWYQDAQQDVLFEVVALDDTAGTIEIQYLEGEVSEIDYESWQQMILIPAKPPEDYNAAYEISMEDMHAYDDIFVPENWENPLTSIESDIYGGFDDYY